MSDTWIIEARTGFAVDGETFGELRDENNTLLSVDDLSIVMRLMGHNITTEYSVASGNFTVVPPVLPATEPTIWKFTLDIAEVNALKNGSNEGEVIIADQNGALLGTLKSVIIKR